MSWWWWWWCRCVCCRWSAMCCRCWQWRLYSTDVYSWSNCGHSLLISLTYMSISSFLIGWCGLAVSQCLQCGWAVMGAGQALIFKTGLLQSVVLAMLLL